MKSIVAPRAVILAAGLGSRLRPLTLDRPKPLVQVHGTPILHNALHNLAAMGVREATVVIGYCGDVIKRSCGDEFAGIRLEYVPSSVFERTGSAYSLWLARDTLLGGDTLLLEGDVFFEPMILTRVLGSLQGNAGAISPFDATMSGSAVTLSANGLFDEIRMNQTVADIPGSTLFKTINIYRFAADSLREVIVPALHTLIESGNTRAYVEYLLSDLIARDALEIDGVQCGDLDWFEIDSEADLRVAETIFAHAPALAAPAAIA
jgi:NDP-sugar pyrophosphorylase family protein